MRAIFKKTQIKFRFSYSKSVFFAFSKEKKSCFVVDSSKLFFIQNEKGNKRKKLRKLTNLYAKKKTEL